MASPWEGAASPQGAAACAASGAWLLLAARIGRGAAELVFSSDQQEVLLRLLRPALWSGATNGRITWATNLPLHIQSI